MTDVQTPPERVGELVRRDDWAERERSVVEDALDFADDMLALNFQLYGDRPREFWWMYFEYVLLGGYPEWKWNNEPQLGLGAFHDATEGSA